MLSPKSTEGNLCQTPTAKAPVAQTRSADQVEKSTAIGESTTKKAAVYDIECIDED